MRALFLLVGLILVSCKSETSQPNLVENNPKTSEYILAPLEVYDFENFKPFLKTDSAKVYVVNFWATWCAPCIKEMPYFETLNNAYHDQNVEVLLVSLDFPKKYDSHLKPYIKKNELKSRVIALNDANSNAWIPQVDPNWSGAIPATLIFNKDKRQFYEQSFTYEELEKELKKFLE